MPTGDDNKALGAFVGISPSSLTPEQTAAFEAMQQVIQAAHAAALVAPQAVRVFHRQPDPAAADRTSPRSLVAFDSFLAIEPSAVEKAFFPFLFGGEEPKPYEMREGGVAIVTIDGPLMQRGGWWYDGYEQISGRLEAAIADKAVRAVVLKISSPGGVCSGCFSAVRSMRSMKEDSGKPIIAFADESAYSAAYAVACVADEIYLPQEGGVGSVGVIGCLEDWTGYNDKVGIKVAVITSGEYKADGHPDVPLKADVIKRYQARITQLADSFAEIVGTARSMAPSAVLKLEAACLYGQDAVSSGLADGIASLDDVIEMAAEKATQTKTPAAKASATNKERAMPEGKPVSATAVATSEPAAVIGEIVSFSHPEFALAVGLAHDASTGDVLAEISRIGAKAKKCDEAEASATAVRAELASLVQEIGVKTFAEAIESIKTERKASRDARAKALINEAISAGKCPANGEKAFAFYEKHGLETLEDHLAGMPVQTALVAAAPAQLAATKPGAKKDEVVLTEEDEKAIRVTGVSRDAFIAARKAEIAAKAARESGSEDQT